jgi:hypothetical protein
VTPPKAVIRVQHRGTIMPTSTFVVFLLISVGLVLPAIVALIRSVRFQERRYDRKRNNKVKPVGSFRYRHLWVVDRDEQEDEL